MRAVWMMKRGGIDRLEVRETPEPKTSADGVRIRVHAAGISFSEILARMGFYPAAPKPPCILGYEVSGTVEEIGADVRGFSAGERVVAMTSFGGHSEIVCVTWNCVVKLPDDVTFDTAAALPVNYLTARHMLVNVANVRNGETVLVQMAAGGVGLALVQLCQTHGGIRVIGTASAGKHDVLHQNGCEYPIDYRTKDYVAEVMRITNGQGVDAVFDPLGGPDWKRGYKLLRSGGKLVVFGFTNLHSGGNRNFFHILHQLAGMPRFTPLKLLGDNRTVAGVTLSGMWGAGLTESLKELVALCQTGALKPVIDSKYPFARVVEAYQRIESRKNIGKVIMIPDSVPA